MREAAAAEVGGGNPIVLLTPNWTPLRIHSLAWYIHRLNKTLIKVVKTAAACLHGRACMDVQIAISAWSRNSQPSIKGQRGPIKNFQAAASSSL